MVLKLVDFICLSLICRNEQSNEKIGIFCNHPMLDFLLSLQNNFRMTLVPLTGPASPKVSEMISERDAVDRSWPPRRSGNRQPSCFERSRQRARSVVPSSLGLRFAVVEAVRKIVHHGRAGGQYKKISHSGISPRDWRHANDASAELPSPLSGSSRVRTQLSNSAGGSSSRESCLYPWGRVSSRHFILKLIEERA